MVILEVKEECDTLVQTREKNAAAKGLVMRSKGQEGQGQGETTPLLKGEKKEKRHRRTFGETGENKNSKDGTRRLDRNI